ncbi:PREDICTED: receptor-like protein 2 isoform X2 [Lupinus angustifolius]|uniref:receptor-like protein 2 isoform X2 n=1 Tax=Lupinus angustifolius TaxID=3871 RepID=UPI00092E4522|nr:PREDICTED: receptor-like protein 2 isoform X2 [Lupinus angustifolius]
MLPYLNPQIHYVTHKMKMKSTTTTTICVFLLILVLLEMNCCEGCLKNEREALLALNAQFDNPLTWEDNTDCCHWKRVQCSNTTKQVVELDLSYVMDYNLLRNWYINFSDFLAFEDLKSLNLSGNSIAYFVEYEEWYKLKKLEELDLSENKFEGSLPSSFCNMTSLRKLQLFGSNNFTGSFSSNIASFTSLEYIDFEGNHFEFPISLTPFSNNSHIKFIYGNGNKLILDLPLTMQTWVPKFQLDTLHLSSSTMTKSLPLPNFLLYQKQLTDLDLSGVKMEVGFPNWLLENNTRMLNLALRSCSFKGTLDLQLNHFPNMETRYGIYSNISSLRVLDISNNHFMGKLPSGWSKNFPILVAIFMSNNKFEGSIPSDFVELENLIYLDLSENKLSGSVPSFITYAPRFIQLKNNELSSLPKRMFHENSSIVMLDLSYNHIRSGIQEMIQDLNETCLNFLLLGGNHFTGQIPKELCQLRNISILDLSHNNFYGPIPSCLGKLPFENDPNTLIQLLDGFYVVAPINPNSQSNTNGNLYNTIKKGSLLFAKEEATFTTKKSSYTYKGSILAYMTGIDLSYNNLDGNIPSELGNLTKIRAMNLSYNNLRGKIPTTFSNLAHIESLDLSFNNLYGSVPPELNILSSLEVFSVAHNNLSGSLPEWKGQFLTFDARSYEGNPFLCGPPLPKSCNPFILPNGSYIEDDDYDHSNNMYIFWVSFGVSFTSVLLVIAIILYINPYWRRVWFYYIELIITNCYYFIEDHMCKFPINI